MNEQRSTCGGCYWKDSCVYSTLCEHYYSPGMEYDDAIIQEYVEEERNKYRREWHRYIQDFDESPKASIFLTL